MCEEIHKFTSPLHRFALSYVHCVLFENSLSETLKTRFWSPLGQRVGCLSPLSRRQPRFMGLYLTDTPNL